ncbi:VP4 [Adult diarrheal rotavirus strain J19]|uniref:Outer capsid protein VP4 n=1 Tax=Rotavirus X (strain RVX/Human/China/NADRV-J19/1997/GXP[X]) TaxID=335103 RepID=VP4_ROTJ1|nr:VP4 [Adult diarrheal rotavirus strain J19]Q45UF8.1 RecName: Full=Outer capsid protein VP4; AltName: Full=Hemagglutinin; Contains: RecName: Full=Outer capsid protein VP8*; Contains: RecName: Full=Outer capsid protein VP5* [Adult diarrheal rotavirus strain J19]AAZ03487.1 VP4 [Adult diarrheal rotavirus strain J19]
MSLRSLLITTEAVGETTQTSDHQTSFSTRTYNEINDRPSLRIEKDGEKAYCFKNLDPVRYDTRMGEYPFDYGGQSTENNQLQFDLFTKDLKADTDIDLSDDVKDDLKRQIMEYYQQGYRAIFLVRPQNQEQHYIASYSSTNLNFTSQPSIGVNLSILNKIQENKLYIYSTQPHIPSVGCEMIAKIFRTDIDNENSLINYSAPVTVTISVTKATFGDTFVCNHPNMNYQDLIPTMTKNSIYHDVKRITKIHEYINSKKKKKNSTSKIGGIQIAESKDGFWKILTKNYQIKLKFGVEGYGVMGGTFGNWLIDSGFKTVETNYEYQRNGKTINATTVASVKPSRKCGTRSPVFGQLQFSGEMMVLSHNDILTVFYTEREWALSNAIYAKNFATDFKRQFEITAQSDELLVRTNVVPHTIKNTPGKALMEYSHGGFGQIDTSDYTGMALTFRFRCISEDLPEGYYDRDKALAFANVGLTSFQDRQEANGTYWVYNTSTVGFGSCYPKKEFEYDINVTYTTLLPSDPEFTTGGTNYAQSVTAVLEESFINLQNQVNEMLTRMNISDLTSGVMSVFSVATSFPQILDGISDLLKAASSAFKKVKGKVGSVAKRLRGKRYVRLFDENVSIEETPRFLDSIRSSRRPSILSNMFNDDETFTALHTLASRTNSVASDVTYLQPIITTRIANSTPPVIAPASSVTYAKLKDISKIINAEIDPKSIMEFNQISNTISILDSTKKLAQYAVDPDIIDGILNKMVGGHARSLFSLKVRKHLLDAVEKDAFVKYNYHDLMGKLLNDRELLDITNNLSSQKQFELAKEFRDLLINALA